MYNKASYKSLENSPRSDFKSVAPNFGLYQVHHQAEYEYKKFKFTI
jgi:hypothetical protein